MGIPKHYFKALLQQRKIELEPRQEKLFESFTSSEEIGVLYKEIEFTIEKIMDMWNKSSKREDILTAHLAPANGMVGKPYKYKFDFSQAPYTSMVDCAIDIPAESGLTYNAETKELEGIPLDKGEFNISMKFKIAEDETSYNVKKITLVINPDPKSLWKNLDSNHEDPYWKEDSASDSMNYENRKVVVASVRGRSHAHEAKFRDDDFVIAHYPESNWALVAVADGAGSAKYSRKGSLIACNVLREFFSANLNAENTTAIDAAIVQLHASKSDEDKIKLRDILTAHFIPAPHEAFKAIESFARETGAALKDFSTTLLFTVFKKFEFGYAVIAFWIGDGGIGIYTKENGELIVPGVPDGGEFAGQTRFLTDPTLFENGNYISRVKFQIVPEFTSLVLMTDGITDPKFQTDANLGRAEKWNELFADLGGNNSDMATVDFTADNKEIEKQLLTWMDFWSPGNHDDRTIAIVI
jgi:hypothetical protein